MTVIKCKMCGGDLQIIEGETVAECEYCGTKQTVPKVDDEKKLTLFSRANRLRSACEFDKAAGVYESIVAEFPQEAEAYWGLVLCRYGIEYVDDPATGKKVPTCHRSSFESVMDDSDFEQALENADAVARRVYRDEAKAIEELRRGILEVSGKEPPYDIFICYKETGENGERTIDSVLAQDTYDVLTEKGYRVFFSRITLEDKLGTEYEPYIFAALNSAKIMLVFGTDYEYFNAVWVKNEWSRYLKLMAQDKMRHLIPCYKGIDAYDMPREFAKLQAQDMGKVGAMQDLLRGIDKIMGRSASGVTVAPLPVAGTAAYTERGFFFLEDGDFVRAADYFERALDQNPRDGRAYLGKIFAGLHVSSLQEFEKLTVNLDGTNDYARAMQFSPASDQEALLSLKNRMQRKYAIWQLRSVLVRGKRKKQIREIEYEWACREAQRQQEEERHRREEEERCHEDKQRQEEKKATRSKYYRNRPFSLIAAGAYHTIGLNEDGTVVACGNNLFGQCDVTSWSDVIEVAGGNNRTVALRSDGTVLSCGDNSSDQCSVSAWTDIVAIACGSRQMVGLRADGMVVACGGNNSGQCNVTSWTDIAAIACGSLHTVGLRTDGTVVACGSNRSGQCNVTGWTDITAIACGSEHTVGLRTDGTVVACGSNSNGECNISDWADVVAIACGEMHTVGLRADGNVVTCGSSDDGQCATSISRWTDIVAIACGSHQTVGLRVDGTTVACGLNRFGQCEVDGWKLFDCFEDVVEHAVTQAKKRNEAREKIRLDKIAALEAEKQCIQAELPHVKGLFSGSKRRDMENRLAEIEKELKKWRSN